METFTPEIETFTVEMETVQAEMETFTVEMEGYAVGMETFTCGTETFTEETVVRQASRSVPPAIAGGSLGGHHPPAIAGGTDSELRSKLAQNIFCAAFNFGGLVKQ